MYYNIICRYAAKVSINILNVKNMKKKMYEKDIAGDRNLSSFYWVILADVRKTMPFVPPRFVPIRFVGTELR